MKGAPLYIVLQGKIQKAKDKGGVCALISTGLAYV
jgi:hypothetical protein